MTDRKDENELIAEGSLKPAATLLHRILDLRDDILATTAPIHERWLESIAPHRAHFGSSIENLAHYLALRKHDLRDLQDDLRPWGLSSLGRIEAQVLPNLDAVLATLARIAGEHPGSLPARPQLEDFNRGESLLTEETAAIFGERPAQRRVRMMVTLPSQAADDPELVRGLVEGGMDIARINCAHDDPTAWAKMIDHLQTATSAIGRTCKVAMDLGGPKSRTAAVRLPDDVRLQVDDTLLLRAEEPDAALPYEVQIQCTLSEALKQVKVGEAVWFDDGKVGTEVIEKRPEGVVLRVTSARAKGERIKEDKGINFPDTELVLDPLTEKDLRDLDFVVQHANIINYSFVQTPEDVRNLQLEVNRRQPPREIGLVLKIETARAIKNLPEMIVAAGSQNPVGVMIARGDLAVEIGFERMAEMQEEILWICEAARVPVIWATQVLETLAKKGRPSRAEVTDAAMSERAECVMLNKGEYILEAIMILDGILTRMEKHQRKKVARLRALQSW